MMRASFHAPTHLISHVIVIVQSMGHVRNPHPHPYPYPYPELYIGKSEISVFAGQISR